MKKNTQLIRKAVEDYYIYNPTLVDKRKSAVKYALSIGITADDIINARLKRIDRFNKKIISNTNHKVVASMGERARFLKAMRECKFNPAANSSRYNCTGIDWKEYHRASSNGRGWVLIAPDEPANNYYIEDVILHNFLKKKYYN